MFDYIDAQGVDVRPAKVFSLQDIAKAHDYVESRQGFGKAVCVVE